MTTMTLRVLNATFESQSSGDYETVDDAYRAVVAAGLRIAADEMLSGTASAIVQVTVDVPGQRAVARGAVAVSNARLLVTADE